MRYTKAEKIDMIFIYGKCRQNMRESIRLYAERFPDRAIPSRSVFSDIIKIFQETGSVGNKKRLRAKKVTDKNNVTNTLAAVIYNPHTNTRQLERMSGISRRSILRIFHTHKFHPHHMSLH